MADAVPQPTVRDTLRRLFGVDLRALAALRMGVATVILVDLATRLTTAEWFLCDQLFFTRELSQQLTSWSQGFWSVYWWHGSSGWAWSLLALNAVAALALWLGWQTRWAGLLCLVLAWSLQVRMPLVLTAGHVLLRTLLVWLLLLPCDRVWSWAARGRPAPAAMWIASPATAGLLVQVVCLYLFAGIAKWNELWLRGDAVFLALQLDMYVQPWGRNLLQWPSVCRGLTWSTLLLEIAGPLLLFMPFGTRSLRAILCVAFYGLHVGVWLAFSIGIFSAVAMIAWIPLWPTDIWERCRWKQRGNRAAEPHTAKTRAWPTRTLGPALGPALGNLLATSVLVYTIILNIANMDPVRSATWFPDVLRRGGNMLMLTQEFKMFARPSAWNYAWRLVRQEPTGDRIDTFSGQPQICPAPQTWPGGVAVYESFPSQIWRRLFFNLAYYGDSPEPPPPLLLELRRRLGIAMFQAWPPNVVPPERTTDSPDRDATSGTLPGAQALLCLRMPIEIHSADAEPTVEVWAEQ